jgi:hypothetical protein
MRGLDDPENDLVGIARAFSASGEACWHVDRHVLGVSDALLAGADSPIAACIVAVALARRWLEAASAIRDSGVLVSRPFVVIDDGWIASSLGATPPHVYICIAREETSFGPVNHDEAMPRASSGCAILDSQLTERESLSRIEGATEGEPGAWIVEILG